jgi:hypothetical protein
MSLRISTYILTIGGNMSDIEYIHTDLPLKKLEYTTKDIFGEYQMKSVITIDGSPANFTEVRFKEVPPRRSQAKWNIPFLELRRYWINSNIFFEYGKYSTFKEDGQKALEWLSNLIKDHLRSGAKKFYYATLCEAYDPDERNPKMKKIDLAKFKPSKRGFSFGDHTIWEFIDSSIE